MILGLSTISWIEQLTHRELLEYFELIDKLLVVVDDPEDEWVEDDRIYYRAGDYNKIRDIIKWWSMCKAYPRKTLYTVNYSLVEIPEGMTAEKLKGVWMNELRASGLLR